MKITIAIPMRTIGNPTHTPTLPWKVDSNRIIQRFYNESSNKQVPSSFDDVVIGTFNSCDQAQEAVRAVNMREDVIRLIKEARQSMAVQCYQDAAKLWAEAILEIKGNIKIKWEYVPAKSGYRCQLETGEIFEP